MTSNEASGIRPEDEVTRLCAELIRIPSVNVGDTQGPGSRLGLARGLPCEGSGWR